MTIKILPNNSYKIGVDEIEGLKEALHSVLAPIQKALKDKVYYNDCEIEDTEYKSRDGFIPHGHNHGGVQISLVIPKCEEYEFSFLEFGEYESEDDEDPDGHLDASLRVWLKFEGLEDGVMSFWLYMGSGNNDAPYFRHKYETTLFEAEFQAKSIFELKKNSAPAIKKLLAIINS